MKLLGVVDSGATRLVLPESVAIQLGLPDAGETRVRYADGRSVTRRVVRDASVQLLGRQGVFKAIVEPGRTDALIGAIVLEDLDFLVDCTKQALYPRDPDMIVSEVE
jgi:predicted aspartyl protease